jgi:hypothetical protein
MPQFALSLQLLLCLVLPYLLLNWSAPIASPDTTRGSTQCQEVEPATHFLHYCSWPRCLFEFSSLHITASVNKFTQLAQ